MNPLTPESKILQLLEQLHHSAQTGRNYAKDIHNQNRYDDLLLNIKKLYEFIPNFNTIQLQPLDKVGYVTPKIGVNAIIENDQGEILLEKRKDDGGWCIIGGWCETHLSPIENIIKEIREETGFDAIAGNIVKIFSRTPSENYPFSSYHILYSCKITTGKLTVSHESEDVKFLKYQEVENWHFDHKSWVEYYLNNKGI